MWLFNKTHAEKDVYSGAEPRNRPAEMQFFKNGYTVKFAIMIFSAVMIYLIFTHGRVSKVINLTLGQMSPTDIYSTADIKFADDDLTVIKKEKAASSVVPVYKIDKKMSDDNTNKIASFLDNILTIYKEPNLSFEEKLKKVKESAAGKITDDDISVLLSSDMQRSDADNVVELYKGIMRSGIMHQGDKLKIYQEIGDKINAADAQSGAIDLRSINSIITLENADDYTFWAAKEYFQNPKFIRSIVNYLLNFISINLLFDKDMTNELKQNARNSVAQEYSYIKKGQIIIRKGDEVTKRHLLILKAQIATDIGTVTREERWYFRFGIILVITISIILFTDFLRNQESEIFWDNSKLLLISIIFVITMLASKYLLHLNERLEIPWLKYLIFIPAASILYAILLNRRISFVLTTLLSIFIGMINANNIHFLILGLAGGSVAIASSTGIMRRWQIMKIGFAIGLANIIFILIFQYVGDFSLEIIFRQCLSGFTGGFLCAFIAAFLVPAFEYLFNIPTDLKLLEFLDLNHPLLKEMVIKAPGTYHHSLMVGNLAETAASSIGANPLLAKVAAYFHDIGKMTKPEYFSENEEYGKSFHKGLNPSMSSLIIMSHVKDGVDLAKKYKLPEVIVNILMEHHGTSLVYYFYKKAETTAGHESSIEEDNYRYRGPRPRSKEAGIVLLTDAIEAASRSLEKPTPARIENLVKEIISDKINDSQLDECELTFREINTIAERIQRVLTAACHSRIRYPKEEENEDSGNETTAKKRRNDFS